MRAFIRKWIYGGRVCSLIKRLISSQYDELVSIISDHFGCREKEANKIYSKYITEKREQFQNEVENGLKDYREISDKAKTEQIT